MKLRTEVYEDQGGQWRWRLRARNGRIVAVSGEGFTREADARRSLQRLLDDVVDDWCAS